MTQKLYSLALGKCSPESADSPMMQEVLLGGHFYLMVLKVSIIIITIYSFWVHVTCLNLLNEKMINFIHCIM
jgi:hypothetical protein